MSIQNHWLDVIEQKKRDKIIDLFKKDLNKFISYLDPVLTQDSFDDIIDFVTYYGQRVKIKKDIKVWKVASKAFDRTTRFYAHRFSYFELDVKFIDGYKRNNHFHFRENRSDQMEIL